MSDKNSIIRRIMGKLNREVVPIVKENGKKAEELSKKVEDALSGPGPGGRYTFSFMHYGSAYEGLAIDEKADFDIAVILGQPFESDNFKVSADPSGYFTLKWKSHIPDKVFSDCNGYVDAANMRRSMFNALGRALSQCHILDGEIKYEDGLHAVKVTVKYTSGRIVEIDLVPQIVFRTWGQCPGLKPLSELPRTLRQYIDTLNKNKSPVMCFSLAASGARKYDNPDQLFSVSFAFLEKKFLTSHTDLRDMVRLVKLVAKHRGWKKSFRYHGFIAKRVAVKYCDELKGKDEWEGYKALLGCLSQEVSNGFLDGFFINGQKAWQWTPQAAEEFQEEIAAAMMIDPRIIERTV